MVVPALFLYTLKVTCGNCNYARYCSESCKESDWADHRDECFYIGRSRKNPSCDTARFALRLKPGIPTCS